MEGKIARKNAAEYKITTPFEMDENKHYVVIEACGQERVNESLERFAEIMIEKG